MSEFAPHRARKRFGQNFLHDHGVINRILRAIAPREGQRVVEIGPGQGALTQGLADSGATVQVHTVRGVGYMLAEAKTA